jgi:hypothetical protein
LSYSAWSSSISKEEGKMAEPKYLKNLVKVPLLELGAPGTVTGRQQKTMTYMSNKLVPGSNTYIEFSWTWAMPNPNPFIPEHVHKDYDEIVIHIGSDPDNPQDLGAEIEFVLDGEKLVIDKTSALFVPKGVPHGPLTWKRVDRPHLEMAIVLGTGELDEALPGGEEGVRD